MGAAPAGKGAGGSPRPHSLVSSLGHILSLGSRIVASSCPARARGPWDWVGVRHCWQRTRAGKHLDHSLWGQEPCPPGRDLLLCRDFPNRSENSERGAGQEAGLGFQGGSFQGPPLLCRELEGLPPPCKVKGTKPEQLCGCCKGQPAAVSPVPGPDGSRRQCTHRPGGGPAPPGDHREALAAAHRPLSSHTKPENSRPKEPSARMSSNSLPPRTRTVSRGDEPQVPLLVAAELRAEPRPPA